MFLGVVSPPDPYEDADGKIMVRRLSKKIVSKGVSISMTFVPDFILNDNIKQGEWHKFFPDAHDISIGEAMDIICNQYNIKPETSACMYFCYMSYNILRKKKVAVWLESTSNNSLLQN